MKKGFVLLIFIFCLASAIWLAFSDESLDHAFVELSIPEGNKPSQDSKKSQRLQAGPTKKIVPSSGSETTELEALISRDFHYLEKNNYLGFKKNDLGDVQVFLDSQIKGEAGLQNIVNLLYSQFPKSAKGTKKLEISVISGRDTNAPVDAKKKNLLVLQFSLTDVASQNKIWEMGRTYNY